LPPNLAGLWGAAIKSFATRFARSGGAVEVPVLPMHEAIQMQDLMSSRVLQWAAPALATLVLAFTLWHHLSRPAEPPPVASATVQSAALAASAAIELNAIAGWSLFGGVDGAPADLAPPPPPTESLEDLPPTTLGLTVSGIAFALDAAHAYAIVGTPDGQQHQYKVGDSLLEGVAIHAIRPLEVIVSNQGKLESVPLPLESTGAGGGAPVGPQFALPVMPQIPTDPEMDGATDPDMAPPGT